jgi:hypothetical protein
MSENTFEFDVEGNKFLGTKLPALEQAKMLKRVLPIFPPIIPFLTELDGIDPENFDMKKVMDLAQPMADALSGLKDDDFSWLIQTSAASVKYLQGENWVVFWNPAAKRAMFEPLNDVSILLPITVRCIQENLSRFFSAMVTNLPRKKTKESTSEQPQKA